MVFRNSVILAVFSGISVVLGIIRDRLLAHYVGVGPVLDVYNASFRIPDLILGVFVAFVASSTVVPFISKSIHTENKKELEEKVNSLFFLFVVSMVSILLIVSIFLPYIASFIVPGFTATQIHDYIFYTRLLMLQPLLLGISALISSIAQVRHRFMLYGAVPLVYTSCIIISIIYCYPTAGIVGIIQGVLIGALLHVCLQSYTLYKEKISIHYSLFSLIHIKEHLRLAVPRSGSIVVSQVRVLFFTAFATSLGAGVLSIYLLAQKISDAIVQTLSQSVSTASLPALSLLYSANDIPNYTKAIKKHGSSLFVIGAIVGVLCFLFSNEIVYLLYGTTGHNQEIAQMFMVLAIGIPFFSLAWYLTYAFSAMKDTRSVLYANIFSTLCAAVICFIAKNIGLGMISIALGVVSVNILSSFLLLVVYKAKGLHLS